MDYQNAIASLWSDTMRLWGPPPKLRLSEWADTYAYLSAESSAQAGKWTCIPYQRGIMDAMTDPAVERITIMKSARVGYTKMITYLIGYQVHQDPCPILVVQPTIEDAQGYSKDEIAPMLRDTPVLVPLAPETKSRDSANTILRKQFPGMTLMMTGANSARGFRRISARIILFDEVDGYPPTAGQEGDQITLGERRAEYYWNKKIILGSTPTIKGFSRIEKSYEQSDQRRYQVPCPHCQHYQPFKWERIDFSTRGTHRKPVYICAGCEQPIEFKHHRWMIENGRWVAEKEFTGHAGFHIWAAYSYSPNATWRHIVREFLNVKDDREQLKSWVNTVLGETWEEEGKSLDVNVLYNRREHYITVPQDAAVLVISADVQKDRLEVLTCAYGRDFEIWALDFQILRGYPTNPGVWKDLDGLIERGYSHDSGIILHPQIVMIDSGYATQEVYQYVKPRERRRVFAVKGASTTIPGHPLVGRASKSNTGKVALYTIGTTTGKDMLFDRLEKAAPGPAYIHFNQAFDFEFMVQLTAEKCVIRHQKGVARREYIKVSPGARNEAIDLMVYNLAGFYALNIRNINEYVSQITRNTPAEGKNARRVRSRGVGEK